MARYSYFVIYKPFGMLSQFTDSTGGKRTLGELYPFPKDVYPVGRLDEDSEGLLILTNDPTANQQLLNQGIEKEYYVQVEGVPNEAALSQLRSGVEIRVKKKIHQTLPAEAFILSEIPILPDRNPPIRVRKLIPDTWISLTLKEGKNRQVRRMTAKVGYPTLRLVRVRLGNLRLPDISPGEVKEFTDDWSWP